MLEVALEGGVGVVDEVSMEGLEVAGEGDGLVDRAVGEAGGWGEVGRVTAEEAELGIGVEAAMANPAIEKKISALEEVGVGGGVAREQGANLGL